MDFKDKRRFSSLEERPQLKRTFIISITLLFSLLVSFSVYFVVNQFISRNISQFYNRSIEEIQRVYKGALLNLLNSSKSDEEIVQFFINESRVAYSAIIAQDGKVVCANTKYEAFLPIISPEEVSGGWVREIPTPVGEISEIAIPFTNQTKKIMIIGFFQPFSKLIKRQEKIYLFFILFLILSLSTVFYLTIISLEKKYYENALMLDRERKEKEQFIMLSGISSGVSHEIKNPLNTLSLIIEKLSLGTDKEETRKLIKIAKREIERIRFITENFSLLLKTSKSEKEWVSVEDSIENASRMLSFFPELKIEFKLNGIKLFCNPYLLNVAFKNIIKNAAEAIGGRGTLRVEAELENANLILKFKDEGPGIKNPGKIFYPFYSDKNYGMGIGLFITKKIIENFNWEISANNWDKGGVIEIKVPEGGYKK